MDKNPDIDIVETQHTIKLSEALALQDMFNSPAWKVYASIRERDRNDIMGTALSLQTEEKDRFAALGAFAVYQDDLEFPHRVIQSIGESMLPVED